MANPSKYTQGYDFSGFQDGNPATPLPADRLDTELANISASTEELRDAVMDVRRADGGLKNRIVTRESLSSNLLALTGADTGDWATATAYVVGDLATSGGRQYQCLVAHTSGTFATDLAAGKWALTAAESSEDAAASAASAAASATLATTTITNFSAVADAEAFNPSSAPEFSRTAGYAAAGDGGGALYKLVVAEPSHEGKYQDAAGNWYEIAEKQVDARMLGAVGDGVTDDTAALQACLDLNVVALLSPGLYRTTSTLLIDPARNRGCGFRSLSTIASRYPYTAQSGGPSWDGTQEAVIKYDGSTSTSAAVIAASAETVGTEPASTFDNTIYGVALDNVVLDANSKAGFGFYGARVQGLHMDRTRARGATVAGFSINGTYSGSMRGCRAYLNPGRGFELGAADDRWSWTTNDKVNAFYIYDLHADSNGSDSTFRESDATLKKANCGVYLGPHRGVAVYGIVSENNFGANIVLEPTSGGNSIYGVYTELGCKYMPGGAGTDAISLGYATQQWGLMFIGTAGATHCVVADGVIATDRIWITGTSPTASREEGAFELRNLTLAGGVKADYAAYRLVNCAVELESITGTSPAGAFTVKGGIQFGAGLDILSTYDEATYAPTLVGNTIAGTGWTYSINAGVAEAIGRRMKASGRITLSAKSGDATGQIAIKLPSTVKSGNNYYASAAVRISSLTTSVVSAYGVAAQNTDKILLYIRTAAAASDSSLALSDLSNTTTIDFECEYVTA